MAEEILPWYDLAISTREQLKRGEIDSVKLRVSNVLECDAVKFLTKIPGLRIDFEVHADFFNGLPTDTLGKENAAWGQKVLEKINNYTKTSDWCEITTV